MKKIKILILILLLSGIVKAQLREQNSINKSSIKIDNKEASRLATKSTTAINNVYQITTALDALPGFTNGDLDWGDADNDGDLDLLVTGNTPWGDKTYLIYNDNGLFTRLDSSSFVQVGYSSAKWVDYDGDGKLDIWLNGNSNSGLIAKLYQNLGNDVFTNITIPMQGMDFAAADWGDYDSDGDLDLILVGVTSSGNKALLYRNDSGTYTELTPGFTPVSFTAAKFGDYDNDGDLDVLVTGSGVSNVPQTYLYRNNGDETWTDVTAIEFTTLLEKVHRGDVKWFDYDEDGDLDFVLTGLNDADTPILNIYQKNTKFDLVQSLPGLKYSSVDYGDFDNDGDADILVTGVNASTATQTILYRKDSAGFVNNGDTIFQRVAYGKAKFGDFDVDGDLDIALMGEYNSKKYLQLYKNNSTIGNNAASAPTALVSTVTSNSVVMSWTAPSDDHTNSTALGYNLRVGSSSLGTDILAPYPDNFTTMGNSSVGNTHKLNNLANGTYYWSVQAVDNEYKTGAWSAEKTFTIGAVQINIQDSLALVALYNATDGANWTNNTNWLTGNVNTWYGVTVDSSRVTRLSLVGNNLNGFIPIEIGDLSELKYLDLGSNGLNNPLPSQIGNLLKLDTLYIANSQLTGSIPSTIGALTNLKILALDRNQLSGNIPIELGNLAQINAIYLHENQFTGTIPYQLGNLTTLEYLYLNNNQLSGTIPIELGNVNTLIDLALYGNQLTGAIPAELGNLTNLNYLDLDYNQLSGTIPWQLGNLSNLTQLFLDNNQLSGSIPIELGNLTNLNLLFLNNNLLSGAVPAEFNNLTKLTNLYLNNNQLTQLNNLSALKSLYKFYIQKNSFDFGDLEAAALNWDSIPLHNYSNQKAISVVKDSLGTGFIDLSFTVYGTNNAISWYKNDQIISGQINSSISIADTSNAAFYAKISNSAFPELILQTEIITIGNSNTTHGILTSEYNALIALYDSTNGASWNNNSNWKGALPVSDWQGITVDGIHVSEINLFYNNLSGTIPSQIGDFPNLKKLNLSLNQISGTIPAEIGNLNQLYFLNLSRNQLSGNIPPEIGNLNWMNEIYLHENQLSGTIPSTIGNLYNLNNLYLHHNQLSGSLPKELGNLTQLYKLGISDNAFTGSIPPEIGNITNLGTLYLNNNQLSGNIPAELGNLTNLSFLELSNNQLSGSVPTQLGQLTNLSNCNLSGNQLNELPLFNSTVLSTNAGEGLRVGYNNLSFYYLALNKANLQTEDKYAPQNDIPLLKSDTVPNTNTAFTINMNELSGKTLSEANNSYLWYKNGISTGVTTENYVFSNYTLADTGYYYLEMTNSQFPNLTIKTQSIHVTNQSTVTLPNSPTNLSATVVSGTQIDLAWTDNSNNEDGFNIYYSTDSTNFTKLTTTIANTTSYNAKSLNSNTTYYFKVCAYNSAGETCSIVASATTTSSTSTPPAPTLNSLNPISGTQIEVNWTDNSNNEDGFYVYYSTDSTNFTYYETANSNSNTFTVNQLTKLTKFYFKVCAFNAAGSSCSNIMSATTPDSNAPSVSDLNHCEGETNQAFVASGTNIKWYSDAGLTNLIATGNSYTPTETNAGVYTYYVTQTINNVESDPAIAKLTIYALPIANAGEDFSLCEKTIPLTANLPSANETGEWFTNNFGTFSYKNKPNTTFYSTYAGTINLIWQVTNNNTGCSNSDNIMVTIFDKPEIPQIKQKGQSIPNFALFICTTPGMKYQWLKDNNEIDGANGQYYIERSNFGSNYGVLITDENGCSSSNNVNYVKTGEIKMKIYPVPAKNNAKIKIACENKGDFYLRISSPSGVLYQNKILNKTDLEQEYSLDINSLKSGIYIIEVIFNNEIKISDKLIIQ